MRGMSEGFFITVNGKPVRVTTTTSVVAAVMMSGEPFGASVHGEARGPLCGMGICMECRATVNGVQHRQCCRLFCEPEMEVVTE